MKVLAIFFVLTPKKKIFWRAGMRGSQQNTSTNAVNQMYLHALSSLSTKPACLKTKISKE